MKKILPLLLLSAIPFFTSCTSPENAISSDTYFKAGQEYAKIGNLANAKKNYLKAIETDPQNDEAQYSLGVLYARSGELSMALTHYKKAVEINPENINYLLGMGVLHGQMANWSEAIDLLKKCATNFPDKPMIHYNLGLALAGGGKPDQAIESYKKALDMDPAFLLPYINLGALYLNLKEYKKSVALLQKADSLSPNTEGVKLLLGTALLKNGNYALAEHEFDMVLSLNPKSGIGHYNKGILLEKKEDQENAVKSFFAAADSQPDFAQPYNRVAYIYANKGEKLDKAISLANKALELDKKHRPEYLDTLSWIYYQKGEYQNAEKYISQSLKEAPSGT
ncbi:MAG: tetratricopeptide repeat protein, partial [Nitrospinota bacterium]